MASSLDVDTILKGASTLLVPFLADFAAVLLAGDDLRDALDQILRRPARDPIAIARSLTPILVARSDALALPLIPALFAAIAIRIARFDSADTAGATT